MMKGNPLPAGVGKHDQTIVLPTLAVASTTPARSKGKQSSRAGTVQIAAHFPEEVRMQLKMIAAERRRDVQDLLAEGLNLIFAKYGRPEIAPVRRTG
jgi:hypothetical protein